MKAALLIAPAVVSALLAYLLTPLARRLSFAVGAVDLPSPRKVHASPMPRLGGLAVLAAFFVVRVVSKTALGSSGPGDRAPAFDAGLLLGLVFVLSVSLVDDLRGVKVKWKALAHFVGASITVAMGVRLAADVHLFGQTVHLGLLAYPLSVLWIVGVTNSFNLVDGLDGLSTGLALISATGLSIVFVLSGQKELAGAVMILAGALAGFLSHNVHPARIFLGDAGANSVGFCLACYALNGGAVLTGGFAILVPVFVLGYPVAETLLSMARRLLRKIESRTGGVFEADRNHIHHRLVALGLGHGRTVLVIYAAGTVGALVGLASIFVTDRQAGFLLAAFLLGAAIGVWRLGYDEFAFFRKGAVLKLYDAPAVRHELFAPFFDLALVPLAFYVAYGLKNDQWMLVRRGGGFVLLVVLMGLVSVAIFWAFGLYHRSGKTEGVTVVAWAALAAVVAAVMSFGLATFINVEPNVPVFVIYALLSVTLLCGSRISYRLLEAETWKGTGEAVLIYGAGKKGAAVHRELLGNRARNMLPVGFLDDDQALLGHRVCGLPVFGPISVLDDTVSKKRRAGDRRIRAVIVSSPKIPQQRLDEANAVCRDRGIPLMLYEVRFSHFIERPSGDDSSGSMPAFKRAASGQWHK